MPEITIFNKRTIGKKLKKFGVGTLILAGLYFGQPLIKDVHDFYKRYDASSEVESEIDDNNYVKAQERLSNFRNILSQGDISELETKIQIIHPDSLLARLNSEEDLEDKKELLLKVHDNYALLGKETFNVDKLYVENLLNIANTKLNEEYSRRDEEGVVKNLERIKNDSLFIRVSRNAASIPIEYRISGSRLDELINSTSNYIKSFIEQKVYYKEMESAIDLSLAIASTTNPARQEKDTKILIDSYAEFTVKGGYLKSFALLKKLEDKYSYKNSLVNVDEEILKRINEM